MSARRAFGFTLLAFLAGCGGGSVENDETPIINTGNTGQSITPSYLSGNWRLSGDQVVAPVTTPNSGNVSVTLVDWDGWGWIPIVNMDVDLDAGVDATGVTIHHGAFGQNGPMIHSLQQDQNDPSHWFIKNARMHEDTEVNSDFMGHYVSVATPAEPDGELRAQLTSRNWADRSGDSFMVLRQFPADGSRVAAAPSEIVVSFNRDVLAATATPERISLLASGGDGSFSDGNEQMILPPSISVSGASLVIGVGGLALADDVYQLTLDGTSQTPLTDVDNQALNGNFDGTAYPADYISTIAIDR